MAHNPVNWFEIYVDDLDRAKAFYEAVLGVTLEPLNAPDAALKMLAFPSDREQHGSSGALVNVEGMAAGGNSVIVYFHCEDCAVEAARVEEAGGKLENPKMAIGDYGFVAHAKDSEGNFFGLHSMQ